MIKEIVTIVLMLMIIIGFAGAQISAIGITLYDWSHGVQISMALWNGFIIWVKLMSLGLIGFIGAVLTGDLN